MRENIRQKYGIEKKTPDSTGAAKKDLEAIQELKKDYNMTEEEFAEFRAKVVADQEEKARKEEKFDKKLKQRAAKKELKQGVKDSCKQQ